MKFILQVNGSLSLPSWRDSENKKERGKEGYNEIPEGFSSASFGLLRFLKDLKKKRLG